MAHPPREGPSDLTTFARSPLIRIAGDTHLSNRRMQQWWHPAPLQTTVLSAGSGSLVRVRRTYANQCLSAGADGASVARCMLRAHRAGPPGAQLRPTSRSSVTQCRGADERRAALTGLGI